MRKLLQKNPKSLEEVKEEEQEGSTAAAVTDRHVETNTEGKLEIGHQGTRRLLKLEASSTHVEAASNSADVEWELVTSKT